MTAFRAITTVYSYYLPEVREVVSALAARYPHEVLLRSVHPGLDDFHEPVMDRVVASQAADVPGLSDFPNRYPTAGSEEAIREYMTALALRGTREVYMLRGDYEGYREVAATRGIRMREIDPAEDPADVPAGHWFLSNPSARDGSILPAGLVERIAGAGHQLFYDLSYLGSTAPATFPLAHPNIAAAAISFSKAYRPSRYVANRLHVPAAWRRAVCRACRRTARRDLQTSRSRVTGLDECRAFRSGPAYGGLTTSAWSWAKLGRTRSEGHRLGVRAKTQPLEPDLDY